MIKLKSLFRRGQSSKYSKDSSKSSSCSLDNEGTATPDTDLTELNDKNIPKPQNSESNKNNNVIENQDFQDSFDFSQNEVNLNTEVRNLTFKKLLL